MDPLVISMVVTMFMVLPTLLAAFPNLAGLETVWRKLRRELLVVAVNTVMGITTLVTIYIIASQPTPQRIFVHWSAATDPLVMVAAVCAVIILFILKPPDDLSQASGAFAVAIIMTIAVYIVIAIAMHIAVYICLFFAYAAAHIFLFCADAVIYIWSFFIETTKCATVATAATTDPTTVMAATTVTVTTTVTATVTTTATKGMLSTTGAIVPWIIVIVIAPIYFLKIEQAPVAYKSGMSHSMCGYPPLARYTD